MSCSDDLEVPVIGCSPGDRWLYPNNRRCEDSFIIKNIRLFYSTTVATKKKTGFDFDANRSQWKFRSRR